MYNEVGMIKTSPATAHKRTMLTCDACLMGGGLTSQRWTKNKMPLCVLFQDTPATKKKKKYSQVELTCEYSTKIYLLMVLVRFRFLPVGSVDGGQLDGVDFEALFRTAFVSRLWMTAVAQKGVMR